MEGRRGVPHPVKGGVSITERPPIPFGKGKGKAGKTHQNQDAKMLRHRDW